MGGEDVESQFIPDPNAPPNSQNPNEFRAIRHLTFWRDGFSVEDGPLLRYDDPANSETLKAIDEGYVHTRFVFETKLSDHFEGKLPRNC